MGFPRNRNIPSSRASAVSSRGSVGVDYALMARRMTLHGVVTRQQLLEATGLSPGSVTKHIDWLLEHGFVELRRVPVPHAKKPIDELWLNSTAATFLCTVIRRDLVMGELLGLDLKPIYRYEARLDSFTQAALLRALVETVERAQQAAREFQRPIDFLGICIDGLVDAADGIIFGVHDVPDWQACQPREILPGIREIPQLHIWPEPACKASGFCAKLKQDRRVAYIEFAKGHVSLASVRDGELDIGKHGTSGHLLHVSVSAETLPCYCGRVGCFQQHLNTNRLSPQIIQKGVAAVLSAFPKTEIAVEWHHPFLLPAQSAQKMGARHFHTVPDGADYALQGLRMLSAQATLDRKVSAILQEGRRAT